MTHGPLAMKAGAPVADNQDSETAGIGGPDLVQDQLLLEKPVVANLSGAIAQVSRGDIVERDNCRQAG